MSIIAFKYVRSLLAMLTAAILTACGLQQSVTEGTASAFDAVFHKQIKTLRLDFTAREELNTDAHEHHSSSQPVMIRIFQLRDKNAFEKAAYQQLTGDASGVLGSALLSEHDAILTPGGSVSLDQPLEKESRYVAVVALFRQPDLIKNSWRLLLTRAVLEPDTARLIELDGHTLKLVEKDKP